MFMLHLITMLDMPFGVKNKTQQLLFLKAFKRGDNNIIVKKPMQDKFRLRRVYTNKRQKKKKCVTMNLMEYTFYTNYTL